MVKNVKCGGFMKKLLIDKFLLVPLVILFFVLSGCANKNAGKIRVMHWGDLVEMSNVSKIIKDIKKTKGIDVVQERVPAGNPYMEKFLTEAAAGIAPDIIFVEASNFKAMVDKGLLVDLTPYIERDKEKDFDIKEYYPQIVDRFTVNGQLYVIPRDIAPICTIYYNKKLFDAAGVRYPKDDWNWDEFLETAKKLTKAGKDGKITQYGFLDEWTIWEPWVLSNGGAIVDNVKNPTKCVLDSPEAISGIQFRADLSEKYHVAPSPSVIAATSMGAQGTASQFMTGAVAMFYTGYWKASYFRSINQFDWDIVMFPKGPKGLRVFPSGGSGYAITTQCKDRDKAWEVLKRFAGEQGQRDLSSQGGIQPAIIKLAESPQFLDNERPKNKKIMLEAVKYITFTPLIMRWEEMDLRYISPALDRVWNGKETSEQALKKVVPEINKEFFSEKKNSGK
jgi:ABC-type glycerol-3-phosphate transport system substrate-binding protein